MATILILIAFTILSAISTWFFYQNHVKKNKIKSEDYLLELSSVRVTETLPKIAKDKVSISSKNIITEETETELETDKVITIQLDEKIEIKDKIQEKKVEIIEEDKKVEELDMSVENKNIKPAILKIEKLYSNFQDEILPMFVTIINFVILLFIVLYFTIQFYFTVN